MATSTTSSRHILLTVLAVIAAVSIAVAVYALSTGARENSAQTGSDASAPAPAETTEQADAPTQSLAADRQSPRLAEAIKALTRNDPSDPRAQGRIDAPVVMLEFSDYSCPQCAAYYARVMPELQPLVDNGTLRIEFHDFAIFDERFNSTLGSLGGVAAGKQGKFWEYLAEAEKMSLSDHPQWTPELATEIAQRAGVPDLQAFQAALNDEGALNDIRHERELVASWGVTGTPAFFINDRFVLGAQDAKVFLATIEAAKADQQG